MQRHRPTLFTLLLIVFVSSFIFGKTDKYRIMWREDPSSSMVIGWNQYSGHSPIVYLDETDHGQQFSQYRFSKAPEASVPSKGMNNQFVRLRGLKPNSTYYFVIRDSEGISQRMSFTTAPASPNARLSIIAGGDSRNNRDVRREANRLVSKLRPHFVLFSGDMTNGDTPDEWRNWFDDWQLTIAPDGHLTPILVARGNHEASNKHLVELFDLPGPDAYYALSFCRDMLRIYTLNSMIPAGGAQKNWLANDLRNHQHVNWKIAQYHLSLKPHTAGKKDNLDGYLHWAPLFQEQQVKLVFESDAHLAKVTWPIRPSNEAGNFDGFIRDDLNGTVYMGEGGWGAPLRDMNDSKPWTRDASSFNQFKWVFVDRSKIEVRTVRISNVDQIQSVDPANIFQSPVGLAVWAPKNGDVVTITKPGLSAPPSMEQPLLAARNTNMEVMDFAASIQHGQILISWTTTNEPGGVLFEIERSTDSGQTFTSIGKIAGKGGADNSYEASDQNLFPAYGKALRYRLKNTLPNGQVAYFAPEEKKSENIGNWDRFPKLRPDRATQQLKIAYELTYDANVVIRMINQDLQETVRIELPNQARGRYLKTIDMAPVDPDIYLLVIRANDRPLRRFRVEKLR